jgi:hypothetical protein
MALNNPVPDNPIPEIRPTYIGEQGPQTYDGPLLEYVPAASITAPPPWQQPLTPQWTQPYTYDFNVSSTGTESVSEKFVVLSVSDHEANLLRELVHDKIMNILCNTEDDMNIDQVDGSLYEYYPLLRSIDEDIYAATNE